MGEGKRSRERKKVEIEEGEREKKKKIGEGGCCGPVAIAWPERPVFFYHLDPGPKSHFIFFLHFLCSINLYPHVNEPFLLDRNNRPSFVALCKLTNSPPLLSKARKSRNIHQ